MDRNYDDDDYEDNEPENCGPVEIPKLPTFGDGRQMGFSDRPQIVEGLLRAGDIACIYGQPGVGKSILAPYLGYCVALGMPFFGRATKVGKVLYVAAEDFDGIVSRYKAKEKRIGQTQNYKITGAIYDLFEPYSHDPSKYTNANQLIKYIIDEDISVVILDTLSRSFPGLDENNHRSMTQLLDNVECIASVRNTAVILVHHDSKADAGRPRGHGSLWARLDTAIYLQRRQSGLVSCSVEKNKTRQSGETFKFSIHAVEAGYDNGLSLITAPMLTEMADGPSCSTREYSKAEFAALQILDELRQAGSVSERELLAACATGYRVSSASQPADRVRVARRVIQSLKGYGVIDIVNGYVLRTDK